MAGGRCVQHTGGHCSCGTAQWRPYRTGRPTYREGRGGEERGEGGDGNVRSVTLGDVADTVESLMLQLVLKNNHDVIIFCRISDMEMESFYPV